jgi:hypothetical protein
LKKQKEEAKQKQKEIRREEKRKAKEKRDGVEAGLESLVDNATKRQKLHENAAVGDASNGAGMRHKPDISVKAYYREFRKVIYGEFVYLSDFDKETVRNWKCSDFHTAAFKCQYIIVPHITIIVQVRYRETSTNFSFLLFVTIICYVETTKHTFFDGSSPFASTPLYMEVHRLHPLPCI